MKVKIDSILSRAYDLMDAEQRKFMANYFGISRHSLRREISTYKAQQRKAAALLAEQEGAQQ